MTQQPQPDDPEPESPAAVVLSALRAVDNPVVRGTAHRLLGSSLPGRDLLVRLVQEPATARAALSRPEAPPGWLASAAEALLSPGSALNAWIAQEDYRTIYRHAAHPDLSPQFVAPATAAGVRADLLDAIAGNPATPPQTLDRVARSGLVDYQSLVKIAEHDRVEAETLRVLARARQKTVSRAADDRLRSDRLRSLRRARHRR